MTGNAAHDYDINLIVQIYGLRTVKSWKDLNSVATQHAGLRFAQNSNLLTATIGDAEKIAAATLGKTYQSAKTGFLKVTAGFAVVAHNLAMQQSFNSDQLIAWGAQLAINERETGGQEIPWRGLGHAVPLAHNYGTIFPALELYLSARDEDKDADDFADRLRIPLTFMHHLNMPVPSADAIIKTAVQIFPWAEPAYDGIKTILAPPAPISREQIIKIINPPSPRPSGPVG